jgi:CHASE3 domain sensor protein
MKTFLERLKEEEKELSQKIAKLEDFVDNNPTYENVGDVQFVLLPAQLNAMIAYLHILQYRIEDLVFNKKD